MAHIPIQVVDERDNPIGQALASEARKMGQIHRIVRIMVENPAGRILLQKRTAKLTWPNCWDNSAAGHVDVGEDYFTAAKRELSEEIGINTDNLIKVGKYYTDAKYQGNDLRRFNMVYKFMTDDTPTNLQKSEVSEVRWFAVAEVKQLIKEQPDRVTDGLVDVISRYY